MLNRKLIITLGHGLVGWALCAATMALGMAVAALPTALTVHALAAPIFFILVSLVYFTRFNDTTPGQTALIFAGVVIGAYALTALFLADHGLEVFANPIATWMPSVLILAATYLTGRLLTAGPAPTAAGSAQRVAE
jgi:hypothetical protein